MNSLKFQSVFDIIGPVMIGPSSSTLLELFVLEKLSLQFLERIQQKLNFSCLIPLPKPIVVTGQTWPL